MTEYDYSPEAYERHLATQHRITRWVDTTNRHAPMNPFAPTPGVRDVPLPAQRRSRSASASHPHSHSHSRSHSHSYSRTQTPSRPTPSRSSTQPTSHSSSSHRPRQPHRSYTLPVHAPAPLPHPAPGAGPIYTIQPRRGEPIVLPYSQGGYVIKPPRGVRVHVQHGPPPTQQQQKQPQPLLQRLFSGLTRRGSASSSSPASPSPSSRSSNRVHGYRHTRTRSF